MVMEHWEWDWDFIEDDSNEYLWEEYIRRIRREESRLRRIEECIANGSDPEMTRRFFRN